MDMRKGRNRVEAMCREEGITIGELVDASHTRTWITFRTKVAVVLRLETMLSYKEIGLMLGYKSRPTKQIKDALKVIHKVHGTTTTKEE